MDEILHYSSFNYKSKCRTCMEDLTDRQHNIFQTPDLRTMLVVCTSLPVEPDDGFPTNMCHSCFLRLSQSYDFQQMCVYSMQRCRDLIASEKDAYTIELAIVKHKLAEHLLSFKESKPVQINFSEEIQEFIHVEPLTGMNVEETGVVEVLPSKKDLNPYEEHARPPPLSVEKAGVIEEVLATVEEPNHYTVYDEHAHPTLKSVEEPDVVEEVLATVEEPNHYTVYDEPAHPTLKSAEEPDVVEEVLAGIYEEQSYKSIETHVSTTNDIGNEIETHISTTKPKKKDKRIYVCDTCNRRFATEVMVAAHKLTHKGVEIFPCAHCGKEFAELYRLRIHIREIHERKEGERLLCPEPGCGRTYALQQTLRKHVREAHKGAPKPRSQQPQPYVCEDCGKVLSSIGTLKNHRFMHTGKELPFECTVCGKRHLTKQKLKDHMNRHEGIKNYVCPHCGTRKTTRTELTTHINFHTGEKKYPCTFCKQVFNGKGNLRRHVRTIHEGIRKYACKYCKKVFGKKETKKHHEMTHTGEKPHECHICQKTFIQLISLQKHMKKHSQATEIISTALARAQDPSCRTEF